MNLDAKKIQMMKDLCDMIERLLPWVQTHDHPQAAEVIWEAEITLAASRRAIAMEEGA